MAINFQHLRSASCPAYLVGPLTSPSPQHSPVVDAVHRFWGDKGILWVDLLFKRQEDGQEFVEKWDKKIKATRLTLLSQEERWGVRLTCHCLHLQEMFTALFNLRPELKPKFLEVLDK